MKYEVKHPTETTTEIAITLKGEELKKAHEAALKKLAKTAKAPGFREGKVPPHIAEKHISPEKLNAELVENAVNQAVIAAFTEANIRPLTRPDVDVKKYEPGETLELVVTSEVFPKITLGDYTSLKTTTKKSTVTEKDVKEVIDRMRAGFAEKKDVTRAAKKDDEVTIDFEGKDTDGQLIKGASGTDHPLQLGSNTFIPGFEDGLVGKKAGETFELPITFPKDYHAAALAGKKAIFSVTVKTVKEVTLPEVNDEFAKKCGPFETAQQLKDDIKSELKAQKDREHEEAIKNDLVEQLIKASTIPVPESLLAEQIKNMEQEITQNLAYRGQTLDQYLEQLGLGKEEWQKKELAGKATQRVQAGLSLAKLGDQENIKVTDDEVDTRREELKKQYPDPKMRQQLDSEDISNELANRIRTEKTVERLRELNKK